VDPSLPLTPAERKQRKADAAVALAKRAHCEQLLQLLCVGVQRCVQLTHLELLGPLSVKATTAVSQPAVFLAASLQFGIVIHVCS
jgi:hypothetical protein